MTALGRHFTQAACSLPWMTHCLEMEVGTSPTVREKPPRQSVFQWKLPTGPSAEALIVAITVKRTQRVRKNTEDQEKTDATGA